VNPPTGHKPLDSIGSLERRRADRVSSQRRELGAPGFDPERYERLLAAADRIARDLRATGIDPDDAGPVVEARDAIRRAIDASARAGGIDQHELGEIRDRAERSVLDLTELSWIVYELVVPNSPWHDALLATLGAARPEPVGWFGLYVAAMCRHAGYRVRPTPDSADALFLSHGRWEVGIGLGAVREDSPPGDGIAPAAEAAARALARTRRAGLIAIDLGDLSRRHLRVVNDAVGIGEMARTIDQVIRDGLATVRERIDPEITSGLLASARCCLENVPASTTTMNRIIRVVPLCHRDDPRRAGIERLARPFGGLGDPTED